MQDFLTHTIVALMMIGFAFNLSDIGFFLIFGAQVLCGVLIVLLAIREKREMRRADRERLSIPERLGYMSIFLLGWSLGFGLTVFGTLSQLIPLKSTDTPFLFSFLTTDSASHTIWYIFIGFIFAVLLSLAFSDRLFPTQSPKKSYARYYLFLLMGYGALLTLVIYQNTIAEIYEGTSYSSSIALQWNYMRITSNLLNLSVGATIVSIIILLAVRLTHLWKHGRKS